MNTNQIDRYRDELSVKAMNGIDFITAAAVVWTGITIIWLLPYSSYNKSIFTFIIGALLLPLAFAMSKVYGTSWKVKDNPLQPLGLWLNFAQLFYFPFLVFILIRQPDYFLMTYVIITGAHFFPYGWFYRETGYAVMAGVVAVGSLILALVLPVENFYLIGAFMVGCLIILAAWLYASYRNKHRALK